MYVTLYELISKEKVKVKKMSLKKITFMYTKCF